MADLSDVESALVSAITAAVYPSGTSGASAVGAPCRIGRGWPTSDQLDTDLAAGNVTISVFPQPGGVRNTVKYERFWQVGTAGSPTLTVSTNENVVTFAGIGGTGQIAGVLWQGKPFAYVVQAADTPATVALAFAGYIAGATVSGAVLTLPVGGDYPLASVVGTSTMNEEIGREEQVFVISLWCPSPTTRDATGKVLQPALRAIDFLTLADNSAGWMRYRGERVDDFPSKDALWRRDLLYTVDYPTNLYQTAVALMFAGLTLNGSSTVQYVVAPPAPSPPLIGAIRFDAFYIASSTTNSINSQVAASLSPAAYNYRLPWFATVTAGVASWPAAPQSVMDAEIAAAASAGLDYWAFDSYQPTDEETDALTLYLSSSVRSQVGFCMLGQFSNWNLGSGAPYSAAAQRDITMFGQAGYVKVLGRPLYYVLAAGTNAQMTAAVAWIRSQATAAGYQNPYVVALSGAALTQYNNVAGYALACGFDAAGAYECPVLNGSVQPYSALVTATETDWSQRSTAGMAMVPTAMTDFDPRPLIQNPQPFYAVPNGWNLNNYYAQGTAAQVAQHIADMVSFIKANPSACAANVGLIYAWNELAEGGPGLMPTYGLGQPNGNVARGLALSAALAAL
jgi:hypothetical protein